MRKLKTFTIGRYRHSWILLVVLLAAASLSQAQPVRSAAAYYNRGNERYKKGDLDGAIADYDAALIFEPRLARAYNMRGSARIPNTVSTCRS